MLVLVVGVFSACVVLIIALLLITSNMSDNQANNSPGGGNAGNDGDGNGGGSCSSQSLRFGQVPAWAGEGTLLGGAATVAARNKATVAKLNSQGGCVDFVLYGDSITSSLATSLSSTFQKHFGDVNAVALGVGGTNVQQLTWRIAGGTERLARAPKCIALLIGTNNVRGDPDFTKTAGYTDELVGWLQAAYPSTKIVLMALLPTTLHETQRANQLYRQVATKRGVVFAECGLDLNPADARLFSKGIHPTAEGFEPILRCLRGIVDPFIR